jgi:HTH-type transcriptional regulator/antitoxin HigA
MTIKPIRTEQDHEAALARIDEIFDAKPGTAEFDELDVLGTLVDSYEKAHWPIDPPSPVEAIKFRIEQGQFKRADLVRLLGSSGKVAEVLARKRQLSKTMIVRLHRSFDIPYESLLSDVKQRSKPAKRRSSRKLKPHTSRVRAAS